MIDEEEEKRSFTSWKLEVLDAIHSDIRTGKRKKDKTEKLLIGPQVKCVAYWIMHHVNQKTMTANPSMDRLAAQCGVSRFTVSDCIDRLVFAGWLEASREARTGNNIYRFNDEIVLDLIDARKQREDEAREVMSERRLTAHLARMRRLDVEVSPHRDVEELQHHDVEVSLDYDVEVSPPEHLSLNYLTGTPEDLAHDGEAIDGVTDPKPSLPPSKSINQTQENKNCPPAENFGAWLDGAPLPVGAHLPTFGRPVPAPPPNAYAAARDVDEINTPFPIPADGTEANRMITDLCQGTEINLTVRRRMLSMLQSGVLTPRMFHGMMNQKMAGAT
jgi:DNA-binding PadR family transcriptional regulator